MTSLPPRLRILGRHLRWHRRKVAALSAGIAVLAVLHVLSPSDPPSVLVLTARHDLAAGTVLTPGDVVETPFPTDLAPTHRAMTRDVIGRAVNAAIAQGTAVTNLSLAGTAWPNLPAGFAAVPARLSDTSIAALLQPGQKVDLAAVDPRAAGITQRLVSDAVVLAVPPVESRSSSQTGRLVIFQVPADQAAIVISRAVSHYLTIIWGG